MESTYTQEANNDARAAIKGVFILNGASSVALLTFIGNNVPELAELLKGKYCENPSTILIYFAFGTGIAVLASGFAFLANNAFFYKKNEQLGKIYKIAAITAFIASLLLFFFGIVKSAFIFNCLF